MDRPPRANPPRFSQQSGPQSPRSNASKRDGHQVAFDESPRKEKPLPSPFSPGAPSPTYGTQPQYDSYNSLPYQPPPEPQDSPVAGGFASDVKRKKSLVKPDRERIDPGHRQYYYRNHAAQLEAEGHGKVELMPSMTGHAPQPQSLRRGKSLLAREDDAPQENGTSGLFKRGTTLRRQKLGHHEPEPEPKAARRCFGSIPGPHDAWVYYCYLITACFPPFLLRVCGIRSPEQQRAWREKMGLVTIIGSLMAAVGFITFGFTQTVCGRPPNRTETQHVGKGFLIVHGYAYDLGNWYHPAVPGYFNSNTDNPLFDNNWNAGGQDASFMFQNVNQRCKGLITLAPGSSVNVDAKGNLGWYFPCNLYNQYGTTGPNLTAYDSPVTCHTQQTARQQFDALTRAAQVYYTWDDVANTNRNLVVYEQTVLDLSLLNWLDKSQVHYPALFDEIKKPNGTFNGKDVTMWFLRTNQKSLAACMQDILTVGYVDSKSIGCVASDVVLYVSLVFIIGVVAIKFGMAVLFGWFFSWRIGSFTQETYQQRMERSRQIEVWTDNIHSIAPIQYRPSVKNAKGGAYSEKRKTFLPSTSRFSRVDGLNGKASPAGRNVTSMYGSPADSNRRFGANTPTGYGSKTFLGAETPDWNRNSRSSTSLGDAHGSDPALPSTCPWPLAKGVLAQPPPDYEPFNYPLAQTICLVTAYSESIEGLRTTLDSLATTDYPNTHKLIMVIADGMVKGSGNSATTPEIVLSMMKDFVIPPEEVMAHSYVAIADGHKRHNMAKVYAGFYDYSDATVEPSTQQRVPIVLVAKVGNPLETNDPKPGNRGKRDSQIVLMSFLQKVMFDERMTTFEYEFFNSIWRVTGVCPDRYETVLCVDADTKVFPDSLSRMVACMVHDTEIMGLCGETKIANKGETWVTMIQVFEYYISHHLTKAFESMFGGVTCLPGCFSMYRIKAPKGDAGFWVPVLANPDIVEHYSENIVDTLHKKNLLLLGEDRYLTTLMLKTFPKRKMIFCPQAVCKTIVPDTFRVLLSQRRRWINSTVHNLAELLLVRDLCGTFCFSMQFVVFMELAGTLVLPAAISFTLYLVIYSIVPGHATPVIPLILLGIILGLPGVLIVITSRKVEYVGWMFIYLLSLPIWNAALPAYAFWHFDDFSWGQTRMVAGEKAGGNHGDKEGEFDSSHIVMKRWAEFERDRRLKSGTHSRDSTYYDVVQRTERTESPKRDSRRYSVVSTSEVSEALLSRPQVPFGSGPGAYEPEITSPSYHASRQRDLTLPTPLSVAMPQRAAIGREGSPVSSASRSNLNHLGEEDTFVQGDYGSHQRLIPSPGERGSPDEQDGSAFQPRLISPPPGAMNMSAMLGTQQGVRHGAVAASNYPGETVNPYRHSLPQMAAPTATYYETGSGEGEVGPSAPMSSRASRGVSLVDHGVVPSASEPRRIPRPSARRQSAKVSTQAPVPASYNTVQQQQFQEETASPRSSYRSTPTLPPGAAAPNQPTQRWNDPRYQ